MYTLILAISLAAPIQEPKELRPELLWGNWSYRYLNMPGEIIFNPDGTYSSRHSTTGDWSHRGDWWIVGPTLHLHEEFITPIIPDIPNRTHYEFKFDIKTYPILDCKTVTLKNRDTSGLK